MSTTNIPFKRRFASPSEEDLRNPDYFSLWAHHNFGTLTWADLHAYKCVVVLGEGKCGKTHEFKQQHDSLCSKGTFSFFIPLEMLHDSELLDALSADAVRDFEEWMALPDREAVFFLDAVDELKLRKGTLRKALRKIKGAIGAQAHRSRFFISCRPADWHEELDLPEIAELIPSLERHANSTETVSSEELFTSVIARDAPLGTDQQTDEKENQDEPVLVVALLPLARNEIVEFAGIYAPKEADSFQRHLEEKEIWHLYQLPADIMLALDQLSAEGKLGNLEEQLDFGIGQRLREGSTKKRHRLCEATATEGAERIALALLLRKRRSLHLKAPAGQAEGLDVATILTDWPVDEQTELLNRPLFEPTGIDAFRFHHRSTQEFLAARRLNKLRIAGLPTKYLYHLLFADILNERVVIPSMEPVAAWLALWNSDIMAEVKERNPLLLFRQGFPSLLSLDLRAELLRRFVDRFGGSEWRGIGVGHQELQRIATPALAPVVRELWDQAYSGHDTRELLLELVYLAPMPECVDLAFQAAHDHDLPHHHRVYSVWAILRCGTKEQKRRIGESIVSGGWPDQIVRSALPELLPEACGLDEFLTLARSLTEAPNSVHGADYALLQSVKSLAISREQRAIIRNELTAALWNNRCEESRIYRASSPYGHFVHAIFAACQATLPSSTDEVSDWAWSLAVAFHFAEPGTSIIIRDDVQRLKEVLQLNVHLREAYFWACFEITEALESPESDWDHFIRCDHPRVLPPFDEEDFGWLKRALLPDGSAARRGVAFYALSPFIRQGENEALARDIAELASDRSDLLSELDTFLNPPVREPSEYEIEQKRWEDEREQEEAERVEQWLAWRQKVLANPELFLNEPNREATLRNIYTALRLNERDSSTWGHWDSSFIADSFSIAFLEQVQKAFSEFWRRTEVSLFSERSPDSRNSYPLSSLMALAALKCEAETPGWAETLTHEEAIRAVRISTIELNGFGSFLPQVEAVFPDAVHDVIGSEIRAQLTSLPCVGSAPILHDVLYHGTPHMQRIAADVIDSSLSLVEAAVPGDTNKELRYAFELVSSYGTGDALCRSAGFIQKLLNASDEAISQDRPHWLSLMVQLSTETACESLLAATENADSQAALDSAISLFAATFGNHHLRVRPNFDALDVHRRVDLLAQLVIRAYQVVRPQDDLHHEGSYTPGTRDNAEDARNFLLRSLASITSTKAISALYNLSTRPEFTHIADRLKEMATELAGQISEPDPMSASNFLKLDKELSYFPYDDASLFAVMNHRIEDFEHHLLNDEQTTVDTLRKVGDEIELRRFISYWLARNSCGAYTITQEAVVIREKRTDIRLHATGFDKYATIEVKLDDKRNRWSSSQLKEALTDQLVGRYMNHERCRAGCLLICIREARCWRHPESREMMTFEETIDWLQSIANEIMEQRPELLLAVKGIDYSATANG